MYTFAFVIGYYHENLYVVVSMYIFHRELWRFQVVVTMTLCCMDVCRWNDHFYMLGTTHISPSSDICW